MSLYIIIAVLLFVAELIYFRIADKFNIVDKPNERSSHSAVVLRGGGVIFLVAAWVWGAFFGFPYPWFLAGMTLVAGVSFVDDIRSLPDSVRLVAQFAGAALAIYQLDMLHWELWWMVALAFVVYVGASNVINFMDGINGITAGYSLAVIAMLTLVNDGVFPAAAGMANFVDADLLYVMVMALAVFCFFNFRPKGKAVCFAGDVGSVGIAFVLLFVLGKAVMVTGDVTWFVFLLVYGVDGCCTIVHRIMLHENLGAAHRKHAYQIMANELKIGHVKVASLYMAMQLVVSLGFVCLCPDDVLCHWLYLAGATVLLVLVYVVFMKKYYHLHEAYLASLNVSVKPDVQRVS